MDDYWDRSRDHETKRVDDVEKHLWLANGAAATVSMAFYQAKGWISPWQLTGALLFVAGLVMLITMKFLAEWNASRDRFRFQDAANRFFANECTNEFLAPNSIRDATAQRVKVLLLFTRFGSGIVFVLGLLCTIVALAHSSLPVTGP